MQAVEDSLSFALDSVTALSNRQKSADSELMELKRETADLKMRLQQLELKEDRQEQQKRLSSLIFSGPVLQAESRRERAANLIESLIRQYIRHALDRTQGRAQEAGRGALLGSRSARDAPERGAVGGVPRADRGENKETEAACPTDTADAVRRDPPPEPREQQRQRAVDTSELADRSDHQRSRVAVQSVAGRCSLGDGGRPALLVAGTAAARLVAALAVASGGAASPVAESVSVLSAAGSVSAAVAAWLGTSPATPARRLLRPSVLVFALRAALEFAAASWSSHRDGV
ncbi:hypothetical protein FJT64_008287 [Amphibalanus amphitrite]|uniref:Uncharacterized protein n=1 Tax=Amphibalanus amphitrite TaxID=1232801 RepID=A0A6A4VVR4_AMPAM|nr:hypothetical protein FJT64_008287 [Amphibalanus amphitrite]